MAAGADAPPRRIDDREDLARLGAHRAAPAYVDYIIGTGIAEYRHTPGILAAQMLTRDLDDGRTEVVTLSWGVARPHPTLRRRRHLGRRLYPEDDDYLVDRETTVSHFEVASAD